VCSSDLKDQFGVRLGACAILDLIKCDKSLRVRNHCILFAVESPYRYFSLCDHASIVGGFTPCRHWCDGRQYIGFIKRACGEVIGSKAAPAQPRQVYPFRVSLIVFRTAKNVVDDIGDKKCKVVDFGYDLWRNNDEAFLFPFNNETHVMSFVNKPWRSPTFKFLKISGTSIATLATAVQEYQNGVFGGRRIVARRQVFKITHAFIIAIDKRFGRLLSDR